MQATPEYVFKTPTATYTLSIEERPGDPYDAFCVTATNDDGYDDWTSDGDLRGAIGVAVMRIIRYEAIPLVKQMLEAA